jgi:hypothetical protein
MASLIHQFWHLAFSFLSFLHETAFDYDGPDCGDYAIYGGAATCPPSEHWDATPCGACIELTEIETQM